MVRLSNSSTANQDDNSMIARPQTFTMNPRSSVNHAKSLTSVDDRKPYDIKVGYTKKKMPPIQSQPQAKCRMVTFFRNGDRFYSGTKVAIQTEKYFKTLGNLLDYLTQRLKISQGVRYVFTLNGRLIKDVSQLEDGESYVASGNKAFQEMDYGSLARLKTAVVRTNAGPLRPEDILLYRQVDPSNESSEFRTERSSSFRNSGTSSLPGSRESCVITVINNYDHSIKSRVLLNLRTNQSFEDVLEDMGQSVKIKNASRMMTPWNEEVRGFSHMRNNLYEVETFYLDSGDVQILRDEMTGKRSRIRNPMKYKLPRSSSEPKYNALTGSIPKTATELYPTLRMRIPNTQENVDSFFRR